MHGPEANSPLYTNLWVLAVGEYELYFIPRIVRLDS